MPNRELDTKAEFRTSLSRKAVERRVEEPGERSTLSRQSDPLAQVACRAGDSSCASAHADTLNRATDSQPARGGQSLVRLQRQYGNRFAQRVLDVARKGDGATDAAPEVEQAVQAARGGGQALDTGVRAQMESAFDADFSGVRVHADAGSDALNRSLNARAFTTGQDVFFRQGAYDPGSSGGRELLAHELAHVVQQNGDKIRRKLTVNAPGDRYEQEADRVARAIVQQEGEPVQKDAEERLVSRQVEEEEEEEEPLETKMEDAWVQRQEEEPEEEEEETAQTKAEGGLAQHQNEKPLTPLRRRVDEKGGKPIHATASAPTLQRLTVRYPSSPSGSRQSGPTRIENADMASDVTGSESILQRLTVTYPNSPSGSRQSGPTRINSTYSVRWTAFIRDDTLCFEFEKVARDAATITVNLYDDQGNGFLGRGVVSWNTGETGYQYVEFTDFPRRPLGDVMDSCEFETILQNDDHPRRGISAWRNVY